MFLSLFCHKLLNKQLYFCTRDCFDAFLPYLDKCKLTTPRIRVGDRGFVVDPTNPKKCIDIDECIQPHKNNCSQICTNFNGTYACSCRDGFDLSDKFSGVCKAKSDEMVHGGAPKKENYDSESS